jgi:hypothetical protein
MKNVIPRLGLGFSCLMIVTIFARTAYSSTIAVPEIDSTSMVTAAAVLAGGYLVIVSRLRRK